ncbi:hypothetical protein BZB76_5828 [Actinomadura pelletieri DSM 43383]|uniref:Uncharacterized protein n=1 Tax=Actinomadura pelletieri DSM 43383 TaxID=1120940 RepID=A0A495QAK5_9ACTN|nr:hypothetical protein BZB76_5828 [Actinomadura pelletieri DSM 43383]
MGEDAADLAKFGASERFADRLGGAASRHAFTPNNTVNATNAAVVAPGVETDHRRGRYDREIPAVVGGDLVVEV